MPKVVRRWVFAAARTRLNWRPVLGAMTLWGERVSKVVGVEGRCVGERRGDLWR